MNLENIIFKFQVFSLTEMQLINHENLNEIVGFNSFHSYRGKGKEYQFQFMPAFPNH